jgi:hypothetical protein
VILPLQYMSKRFWYPNWTWATIVQFQKKTGRLHSNKSDQQLLIHCFLKIVITTLKFCLFVSLSSHLIVDNLMWIWILDIKEAIGGGINWEEPPNTATDQKDSEKKEKKQSGSKTTEIKHASKLDPKHRKVSIGTSSEYIPFEIFLFCQCLLLSSLSVYILKISYFHVFFVEIRTIRTSPL